MKHKLKLLVFFTCIIALSFCACYSEDYFIHQLDKQFGAGTYTFEKNKDDKGKESSYTVTLKDYPEYPFHVGSGVSGLPYEYSTFQTVFCNAIYDRYAKEEIANPSLYELIYDGYFRFELKHDMNPSEAESIYAETEKLLSVINDEYPIYNTQDYDIGVTRWKYSGNSPSTPYILADCCSGSLQISSKEDFLAYRELIQEESNPPAGEGITVNSNRSLSIAIGSDTLRTLALKGFHIDGFDGLSPLLDAMTAPGEKGTSAWSLLDYSLDYENIYLGVYRNKDTMSKNENYVYIETTNLGSEACAVKDTTVTKVVFHFYHIDSSAYPGDCQLFLDSMCGDISRGDDGFDISTRWEIGKPKTEEEKQNGIRYKDVLVKIQSELARQGPIEMLTDAPQNVKHMDITITWDPIDK